MEKNEFKYRLEPDSWTSPLPLDHLWGTSAKRVLDLGFGKGRFLISRATQFTDHRFLGIERQLTRVRKMDRKLQREHIENVTLLRIDALYAVHYLLPPCSFNEIFVLHPDPWPKLKHHKNRLMNPDCIDALARVLCPQGQLHFATDHLPYYHQVATFMSAHPEFTVMPSFYPTPEERSDFELYYRDTKPIGRMSVIKTPSS